MLTFTFTAATHNAVHKTELLVCIEEGHGSQCGRLVDSIPLEFDLHSIIDLQKLHFTKLNQIIFFFTLKIRESIHNNRSFAKNCNLPFLLRFRSPLLLIREKKNFSYHVHTSKGNFFSHENFFFLSGIEF